MEPLGCYGIQFLIEMAYLLLLLYIGCRRKWNCERLLFLSHHAGGVHLANLLTYYTS